MSSKSALRHLSKLVAALVFGHASVAGAAVYDNMTIDYVGVVSWVPQYGGFVTFVGGIPTGLAGQLPNPCVNGVATFDPSQTYSKYWYMAFLTAKASALKVQVEISQDTYNNCFVSSARLKE
jgi:hypothetical protein